MATYVKTLRPNHMVQFGGEMPAGTVYKVDDEQAVKWVDIGYAEEVSESTFESAKREQREATARERERILATASDQQGARMGAGEDLENLLRRDPRFQTVIDQMVAERVATLGLSPVTSQSFPNRVSGLDQLPVNVRQSLAAAGYETQEQVDAASDDDLLEVEGVGDGMLARIRGR
jgi:hypothetical protein